VPKDFNCPKAEMEASAATISAGVAESQLLEGAANAEGIENNVIAEEKHVENSDEDDCPPAPLTKWEKKLIQMVSVQRDMPGYHCSPTDAIVAVDSSWQGNTSVYLVEVGSKGEVCFFQPASM